LFGRFGTRVVTGWLATLLLVASVLAPAAVQAQSQDQSIADPRLFAQTGYRVDRDIFWDYFTHRGGVISFGYPVSRDFQFEGCTVQFFQRIVMQQCGNAGVSTLNLLDDGLLPYTRMNGSTFPASDASLAATAPKVTDADYGSRILQFVRANAPDTFDGQAVNFGKTFFNTISASTGGTSDPNLLGLLDLEIWGAPTSPPAYDPSNHNFIYQRFQRGIMHFDKGCGCTQGLLLADYLKELVTGQDLPSDLATQAVASPLLRSATNGHAPFATTYGNAFTPGPGSATAIAQDPTLLALNTNTPSNATLVSGATPLPPPTPVPSPDFGMSMFLWDQPATTTRDLKIAGGANFHWQKTLFSWKDIEGTGKGIYNWTEADRIVRASAANGIKIIARIDFQPAWARKDGAHNGPPDNYQDYADFITAFATRVSG
jgi:hypothetical protein